MTEQDLVAKRLDYAWGWFQFHAKQRMDMFNYFLIVTGILATAFVDLSKDGHPHLAQTLAGLGAVTALGFLVLDLRNKHLVDKSVRILKVLEKQDIFAGLHDDKGKALGLCEEGDLTFENAPPLLDRLTHHSVIFRIIQIIVALGWIAFLRAA
jgi:hypothetical protein